MNDKNSNLAYGAPAVGGDVEVLLQSAVEGMFVLDRDRQYISFSAGCEKLTGYSQAEIVGTSCRCRDGMDCRDESGRSLAGALCPGLAVFHGEMPQALQRMRLARKQGDHVWVETLYSPMHDESGEIIGVVGLMRAVTPPLNTSSMTADLTGKAIHSLPAVGGGYAEEDSAGEAVAVGAEVAGGGVLDGVLLDVERKEILAALRRARGQRARAARALGISRSRLYRRMEVLGIDPRADL